jgi:hypothetical protein
VPLLLAARAAASPSRRVWRRLIDGKVTQQTTRNVPNVPM